MSAPPPPPRRQAKRWTFTLNNPTAPLPIPTDVGFLSYQKEVGEQGTPHFQGYVEFKKQLRMSDIKKFSGGWERAHLEVSKGDAESNLVYTTKDETRCASGEQVYFGTPAKSGVKRGYTIMCDSLREGTFNRDDHLEEYLKHKRSVDEFIREKRSVKASDLAVPDLVLRSWQKEIVAIVQGPVDPRKVYWYYDTVGGAGKSTFTKYLMKNHGALSISTTAKDRVIRAYDHQPVVILDLTREEGQQGHINYSVLETLKNGYGFNTMYEPGQKCWHPPHVIVFSNFGPDETKLSVDRWVIVNILQAIVPFVPDGPAAAVPDHFLDDFISS